MLTPDKENVHRKDDWDTMGMRDIESVELKGFSQQRANPLKVALDDFDQWCSVSSAC